MGVIETSAALGACVLVLMVAVALDRRPYRPGKRNFVPIMIIAVAASLVLGLLSLMVACVARAREGGKVKERWSSKSRSVRLSRRTSPFASAPTSSRCARRSRS